MDTYNNKSYFVLPSDMIKSLDLNSLEQNSYEEIRKSIDGSMCIVEYREELQAFGGTFLTHKQAIDLMATDEWRVDDPITSSTL